MVCENGYLSECFAQKETRKRMKIFLVIAILLPFLIPGQTNAWWPFGPSNFDDCILKYQKEAKCERASILINSSCKCKFNPEAREGDDISGSGLDPLFRGIGTPRICQYNSAVYDCILDNIGNAQNDKAAVAIFNSCVSKYNK